MTEAPEEKDKTREAGAPHRGDECPVSVGVGLSAIAAQGLSKAVSKIMFHTTYRAAA